MPRSDGVVALGAGRVPRDAAASFCGGAGGAISGPVDGAEAPSGPRGSSTASSLVDWTPYCRRRGPRPAGERGAAAAVGAEPAVGLVEGVRESASPVSSWSCFEALGAGLDRDGTSGRGSASHSNVIVMSVHTSPRRAVFVSKIHWRSSSSSVWECYWRSRAKAESHVRYLDVLARYDIA
jgi:hypothetical protein